MNCGTCGECVTVGELAAIRLPSGGVIHVCDTCAVRCPGEAVEVAQVAPPGEALTLEEVTSAA